MPYGRRTDSLLEQIEELKRRIANLERAGQLGSSAIMGGALALMSEDGELTYAEMGTYTDRAGNERIGLTVNTIDPSIASFRSLEIGSAGIQVPATHATMVPLSGSFVDVTSSSFQDTHRAIFHQAVTDGYVVEVPWVTDGGTTGEIRIANVITGGNTTDAISVAAGSSGFAVFAWLHGQPLTTGPFQPTVQARRTGGAGNVRIFAPQKSYQVAGYIAGATASGV